MIRINGWSAAAAAAALLALAACGGGGTGYPSEPTLVAVGTQEGALVSGGLGHFTATVRSASAARGVVVDFYLRAPAGGSCQALPRAAASTAPFDVAGELPSAAVRSSRRFFTTSLSYTPDESLREVRIVQSLQLPVLEDGRYEVVAAVRGKEGACQAAAAVPVAAPSLPDLTHTATTLRTSAFRLPAGTAAGSYRPAPAFALASEIANVGRALQGEVEVGFSLVLDGVEYPLHVEQDLDGSGPVRVDRYRYRPRVRGGLAEPMLQGDVRAAAHRLHLGSAALERLRSVQAEKTCTLKVTIDPDRKVAQAAREDDVVALPVRFLLGAAPCAPSDAGLTQVQYCFGPDDGNSSSAAPPGRLASQFSMADSATNPTYVAATANGAQGIPSRMVLNLGTHSGAAKGGDPAGSGLLDVSLTFTVAPLGSGASPASFAGDVAILGYKVLSIDRSVPQTIAEAKDFPGWKKDVKKQVFTDVDVLGFIPVQFALGIEGEVGFGGSATAEWEVGTGHVQWDIGVVPYLGVSAWAEAAVDLVVCEVGVGMDVDVFHVQPNFRFNGDVFLESAAGKADATLFLDVAAPIAVKAFDGEFYLFVKVPLVHTWKDPVLSWNGLAWNLDIVAPTQLYLGPVGQFVFQSDASDAMVHAIHASTPVPSGKSYAWTGRVSLDATGYLFQFRHLKTVKLTKSGQPDIDVVTACGSGSRSITIPTSGTWQLFASTDASCNWSAPDGADLWWTQSVPGSLGGLSGRAPTGDGQAGCAVGEWLYNSDIFQDTPDPASFRCAQGVSINEGLFAQPGGWVNSPVDGLWAMWRGQLPYSAPSQVLFTFRGNPPPQCYGGAANYTGDLIELKIFDATGSLVYASSAQASGGGSPLNPFPWDASGNGQLVVSLSGPAPFSYVLKYHPLDFGDCGVNAYPAALSMAAVPLGYWMVETTCAKGGVQTTLPPVTLSAPADASRGTTAPGGGGVFMENACAGPGGYDTFVSEYAVGAFDFSNQQAVAQDYQFIVGASVPHGYELFVDGARVASRAASDPAASTDPCSATTCSTREKTLVQTLTNARPYHVVEGFFTNPLGTGRAFSDDRIRWTSAPPGTIRGRLYASAAELQLALDGDPTAGTAPAPLLEYERLEILPSFVTWNGPDACNYETRQEFDCATSLLPVGGNGMGFASLWEGQAALQDQVPYLVTVTTDRDLVGFWLDGQPFTTFQVGPNAPVPFNPFPAGAFYGALMNKTAPTASGLNTLRFATSAPQPASVTSSYLQTSITAGAPGAFLVVFVDWFGTPRATTPVTGNHGTGSAQSICLGQGCGPGGVAVPSWSTAAYVMAAPIGDPTGALQTPQSNAIDLVATVTSNATAGQVLDLCVNGWCTAGNALTGSNAFASPAFFPYVRGDGSSGEQALTSQQANTLVAALRYAPSCPGGDCSQLAIRVDLSYRSHAW